MRREFLATVSRIVSLIRMMAIGRLCVVVGLFYPTIYASLTCRGKRVIGKEAFYFPNLFLYCAEEIYEHVKVA